MSEIKKSSIKASDEEKNQDQIIESSLDEEQDQIKKRSKKTRI
jgi:hypothetical protein